MDDLPPSSAPWSYLAAYIYNRGEALGLERDGCRPTAALWDERFQRDGRVPSTELDALKCLFFFQRLHHHLDVPPDDERMAFIRALVDRLHALNTPPAAPVLLDALSQYRRARLAFLDALRTGTSNRDPIAEFSERLVASLYGGTLAESRVQKGHDVETPGGERVQVKYLANPPGAWINGHVVTVLPDVERYDVVLFEDLWPTAVLSFPLARLGAIAAELRKRHGDTDRMLQLTRANVAQLLKERAAFEAQGMRITLLDG